MKICKISISLILISLMVILLGSWTAPTVKPYVKEEIEFRSVWVCTVSNMDVDMQMGTSEDAINNWKKQYLEILETSKAKSCNAIIFQVRPNNDAFYPSKYNPWSEYLAGYGVDPGWDPLEWMIEVTHAAGLEYHAWLNPYRTSTMTLSYTPYGYDSATKSNYWCDNDEAEAYNYKQDFFTGLANTLKHQNNIVDNPVMDTGNVLDEEIVFGAEGKFVLNPANPRTIQHLNNTIDELVTNYDIDGIHFDDYFYPDDKNYRGNNNNYKGITFSTEPKYDYQDYMAYKGNGGTLSIYDWRRENVNNLIHSLSQIIRAHNETSKVKCAFGISPAARWAPSIETCPAGSPRAAEGGEDSGCNNYYSYSDLYADTRKWVKENWIDYILPQAYTYLGTSSNGTPTGTYSSIVSWWSKEIVGTKCRLYIGTPAYQIATWRSGKLCELTELFYQIRYCQSMNFNVDGFVMFRYKSIISGDGEKAMNTVIKNLWPMAALTPIYESYSYPKVTSSASITKIDRNDENNYSVYYEGVDNAKAYGIVDEDGTAVARVLGKDYVMNFNAQSGKKYYLITYSPDNTIFEERKEIDLSIAKDNEAPVITMNDVEKEYLTSESVTFTAQVTDDRDAELTYQVYQYYDDASYLYKEGIVEGNSIEFTYKMDQYPTENIAFEVVVSDGKNESRFKTSYFNVVSKKTDPTPTPPTPVDPVDPTPVPTEPKKKCGKKSMIFVELLSMISLMGIIIRRKK